MARGINSASLGASEANYLVAEAELVRLCSTSIVVSDRTGRVAELTRNAIDWERVIRLAAWHAVLPLMAWYLERACRGLVPASILERLRHSFRANWLRNHQLAGELLRISQVFAGHGIALLAFKGPTLAVTAYGDLALRQFTDLDLLIRCSDFSAASGLLVDAGYRPRFDGRAIESGFFQANKEVFVRDSGLRCQVDLHWLLTPRYFPFTPAPEALWARCCPVELAGGSVRGLAPSDLMLMLCAHGSRHGWDQLAMVCDVAELLRSHPEIDWRATAEQARVLGSRRMLLLGLELARTILGAELPAELDAPARADSAVGSLALAIRRRMFAATPDSGARFQPWAVPLRTIERRRERIRYCLDRAFAPTADDGRFVRLPRALFPLYYILRPLRLGWGLTRGLARSLAAAQ